MKPLPFSLASIWGLACAPMTVFGQHGHDHDHGCDDPDHDHTGHRHAAVGDGMPNWFTGANIDVGGVLFPHFHAAGAFGGSTADPVSRLSLGHHDPQRTSTLQTLHPSVSLRLGEHVSGFANYSAFTDAAGDFDGEWEEAFLKLTDLPGGFEVRGGRMLNRFGFQNAAHNHAWDFVNQNLLNGLLLQEGELTTDGGELTWNAPTPFRSSFSFSYGRTPAHSEDHGHGEGEEEPLFDPDGARFSEDVYGVTYNAHFAGGGGRSHRAVASAAWGENEYGRQTQIYGLGYEYAWQENPPAAGGRYFRWRNEVAYRRFGAVSATHEEEGGHGQEEHGHHEEEELIHRSFDDVGIYSMVVYGLNDRVEAALRGGYVSGISDLGLEERWRISPNVTFSLNPERTVYLRLQYDYDHLEESRGEHSIWAQVGCSWGGPEVR